MLGRSVSVSLPAHLSDSCGRLTNRAAARLRAHPRGVCLVNVSILLSPRLCNFCQKHGDTARETQKVSLVLSAEHHCRLAELKQAQAGSCRASQRLARVPAGVVVSQQAETRKEGGGRARMAR